MTKPKNFKSVSFRVAADNWEKLSQLEKGKRSEAINRALRDALDAVLERLAQAEDVASGKAAGKR